MLSARPWLDQGDVFENVPILAPKVGEDGELSSDTSHGPALLMTHGCALDKTNRRGAVRILRLAFLPLRSVSYAPEDQRRELRRDLLNPSEVLYIPDAGRFGESYCILSEVYYLPAGAFGLRLVSFDHPDAEEGSLHLEATVNGGRVGRLEVERVDLLKRKWIGYWTRLVYDEAVPTPNPN